MLSRMVVSCNLQASMSLLFAIQVVWAVPETLHHHTVQVRR